MNMIARGSIAPSNTTGALLAPKIKGNLFMGGAIYPDQLACRCGGRWKKQTFRKQTFWSCEKCDEEPKFFVLRKYLPIPGTRGRQVPVRYDHSGRRLTSIAMAESTKEHINALITSGKFDHTQFMAKEGASLHLFENFIEKKYLPSYEAKLASGEFKPSSMVAKKQYLNNHLTPHFKGVNIKSIDRVAVNKFYDESKASPRMKDLAAQELKRVMNYAHEVGVIESVPKFPKQKKAKLKSADLFLSREQQNEVIERVDNDMYRVMISILCYFGIRPSEVRALKWSDWNFKTSTLWIRRHVTFRSIVIPGRKSSDDSHTLPITPELMRIIENIPRPIDQDEYMFKGVKGEIISEHCLSRAWKKAIKLTSIPYVDMYRGTKSSTLSQMLQRGATKSDIAIMAGLTEEVAGRYAQHNSESLREMKIKVLSVK